MNSPIGHTFMYNIIIIFIVIVFAFIMAIMSYYKAFKINNRIIGSIEKFEGYNLLSKEEIDINMRNLGYRVGDSSDCRQEYRGMQLVTINNTENFEYCIYISEENPKPNTYYQYGVLTYMNFDLPLIEKFDIPVFTRTNRIYKFSQD